MLRKIIEIFQTESNIKDKLDASSKLTAHDMDSLWTSLPLKAFQAVYRFKENWS